MKTLRPVLATLALGISLFLSSPNARGQTAEEGLHKNNVMIVLDSSGSMNDRMGNVRKIDAAKKALIAALKQIPPDTQIGLLVFSARGSQNDYVFPLGPRDDARLQQAIMQPEPGGNTPLGAYIKKGSDYLLAQRSRQRGYGTYRLLLVTDGESTDQLVDPYMPDVLARGILVDVIGVNMKSNHTLATKVHSYRRADDPAALQRAVAEVFAEVSDKGTGVADERALAEIATLPTEMAAALLQALSDTNTGNQPIGTKPPAPAPVAVARQTVAPPSKAPAPPAATPQAARAQPQPPAGRSRGGSATKVILMFFLIIGIFVVFVAVLALRVAKMRSGGGGPRGRRR